MLLQPASRGPITLASADPAEPPVIDPGYLSEAADLDRCWPAYGWRRSCPTTGRSRRYVGEPMDPCPGKVDDDALERHIREHAETLYHPVGTCRMGTTGCGGRHRTAGARAGRACGWSTRR